MARGARPTPTGFDRDFLSQRIKELDLRSVDAEDNGLHWGYVTSLRNGDLTCPGAKMLPALAAFVQVTPRELYAVTDEAVTVCHLRHFRGWTMNEAAKARGWPYTAYKGFEMGNPLTKEMSTSASWAKTAKLFGVPEHAMRRAWEASRKLLNGEPAGS